MQTDIEIKNNGLKVLTDHLGNVEAEKFISLMIKEKFDYTKWQQILWPNRSIDDISYKAMGYREVNAI